MEDQRPQAVVVIPSRARIIPDKVSIVKGASVSQIRAVLTEAGFGERDVRIQGVDIDELDQSMLQRLVGDDSTTLRELPIIVEGIGTGSLSTLLRRLDGVQVLPGDFGRLAGKTNTLPTMTITTTPQMHQMITVDPVTVTGTVRSSFDGWREQLVIEGITRGELERALDSMGIDLNRVRIRPARLSDEG